MDKLFYTNCITKNKRAFGQPPLPNGKSINELCRYSAHNRTIINLWALMNVYLLIEKNSKINTVVVDG
ncbi:hypothetical protein QTP88_014197 [Uroleucon formosanum]